MADDRASLLTEQQRDYLRLVHSGLTSKEIAQRLGGSHHTVNVQVAAAARLLGARNRAEAAALLSEVEAASYERSYDPPDVADAIDPVTSSGSRGRQSSSGRGLPLPVPTVGRPRNDLTTWQRIFWILLLAALTALVVGGLVSGIVAQLDGLGRRV